MMTLATFNPSVTNSVAALDRAMRQPAVTYRAGQIHDDRGCTVVCATRPGSPSSTTVTRAGAIAQELGAHLILLHVIDSRDAPRAARRRSVLARAVLEEHEHAFAQLGISTRVVIRSGRPQDVIADAAVEWDADVIVLGPYRRRVADALRGTSAEHIAHRAERPVLVVNRKPTSKNAPYQHVLLTSDLSAMTAGVARVAKQLGLLQRSSVSVVHALDDARTSMLSRSGVGSAGIALYRRSLSRLAADEIGAQLSSVGLDAGQFTIVLPQATPVRAIEQTARLSGSDLIVVGCSRLAGLKRVLSDSVSNRVLRWTEHDVLLVSPAAARRARSHTSRRWPQRAAPLPS